MAENNTNIPGKRKRRGPYNKSKYVENAKEPRCTTWFKKNKLSSSSLPTGLDDEDEHLISNQDFNDMTLGKL